MNDKDRIVQVALALCSLDDREPTGVHFGAAVCEAVRLVAAFEVLERMREPPPAPPKPLKRNRASQPATTEH